MSDPRDPRARKESRGPFRADQLKPGDRYELSDGHSKYCAPTGGDGARAVVTGAQALETDPDVESAGVDAGFTSAPGMLRAPDVAVGNVPDAPGWIAGVPPLAVEYASVGQDEAELQEKIRDLLDAGTRWVWVARLLGPRRVEVYERGRPVRIVAAGEHLAAPGVLRNPVAVEALFERDASHEHVLRNLLQRKGYADLDAVLTKGREQGREEGREEGRIAALQNSLREILRARNIVFSDADDARISACRDAATLDSWLVRAATRDAIADILA